MQSRGYVFKFFALCCRPQSSFDMKIFIENLKSGQGFLRGFSLACKIVGEGKNYIL